MEIADIKAGKRYTNGKGQIRLVKLLTAKYALYLCVGNNQEHLTQPDRFAKWAKREIPHADQACRRQLAIEAIAADLCDRTVAQLRESGKEWRDYWIARATRHLSLRDPSGQPWVVVLDSDQTLSEIPYGVEDSLEFAQRIAYLRGQKELVDRQGFRKVILTEGK